MTLDELIAVADEAYGDGAVADAHTGKNAGDVLYEGDTLALFIARELASTYEADEEGDVQLLHASQVISSSRNQLEDVEIALAHAVQK